MPRRNNTPPHVPFHREFTCVKKRRYATEKQAREAAEYQMLIKTGLELSVYICDQCGYWHLTSNTF